MGPRSSLILAAERVTCPAVTLAKAEVETCEGLPVELLSKAEVLAAPGPKEEVPPEVEVLPKAETGALLGLLPKAAGVDVPQKTDCGTLDPNAEEFPKPEGRA